MELEQLRRSYADGFLQIDQFPRNPMDAFKTWFEEAKAADRPDWLEVNAMTVATSSASGDVSARILLLKKITADGFVFFTNYDSAKGIHLAENAQAELLFYWPHREQQIRIHGSTEKTSAALSDEYFHERPRGSQLGAAVSPQSSLVDSREQLVESAIKLESELNGAEVPRPANWGGYLLRPNRFEFWQGRPSRLHDRIVFQISNDGWQITRIAP
ncbi:MAG TPA: pyridoxamine 5'-phosphate oxidase [Planctomycetaceae bacterium]|nr:pyridoxamine 5'-phosphate oxidase [Planctomycetaceae bacterium]